MSFKDKRERGSALACYSDEYNDIPWGYAHVGIQLKRSFPKDRLATDPKVIDCIEWTFNGDVKAYEAAAREEQHKVEELKEQCEQHFPILKKMDFDYGLRHTLVWMIPEAHHLLLYKEFRNQAWSMWQDIPQLVKASKLDFKDYTVEPLPGPWRYRFL